MPFVRGFLRLHHLRRNEPSLLQAGLLRPAITLVMVGSLIAGAFSSILYSSESNYQNYLAQIDRQEVKYFGILLMFT